MSEESNESAGLVHVQVTQAGVTKAVRNILANEMNLDTAKVKQDVIAQANQIIQREVIDYLKGSSYGQAQLKERVERTIEYSIKGEVLRNMVKEIVKDLVARHIRDEVEGVVAALVKETYEIKIGWDKRVPVKLSRTERE